jgi:hypothetical protein
MARRQAAYIPVPDTNRGHGFVVLLHARQLRVLTTGTSFRLVAALGLCKTWLPLIGFAV